MGIVLDTSVFDAAERGRFDLEQFLLAEGTTQAFMASITASELLVGAFRADAAKYRKAISRFPVLPFDLRVGRVHAELAAQLATAGTSVGVLDLRIAATAIAGGDEVAARDLRSFPKVLGLRVRAV